MNDKLLHALVLHARAMWKHRWLGLYTAFGVAMLCALVIFLIPRKYEASARIFANTDSILKPLMAGMTVQPDLNERVVMLSRIVISRPNVEKLIKETGLDDRVKSEGEREELIDEVMRVLKLQRSGTQNGNIFVVKFRDSRPDRAQRVVELLVSMFIDTSKGGGESDTEAAKTFLNEQAATYEKKLRDAEDRLKDFRLKNIDSGSTVEGKDYFAQMATISEQLSSARLQLREAENSRDAFRRELEGERSGASLAGAGGGEDERIRDLDVRIETMRRNLDGLLQRYTDDHPDVVGARRLIKEVEEQRQQLVADYRRAGVPLGRGLGAGPRASEQIKVSLAQAEATVASLRARVAEYSQRAQELRELARKRPEYEAELAQLNRDYEVNKTNYENLIARRESVNISGDMQAVSGVADFRLIDPPRVNAGAVFPDRRFFLSATLLLSLVAGLAVMFVANQLRPCVFDRKGLRALTGLPVLGTVSAVINDLNRHEQRAELRRLIKVMALFSGVYLLFVVAMALMTKAEV